MTCSVHGEPTEFGMRVGLSRIGGNVGVEIIQPLDDRSHHAASLLQHNGVDHIHHVSMKVENHSDATERLDRFGLRKPLEATFSGAPGIESFFEGTYFSTEAELGFIVEIGHAPDSFVMPPAESVYPPSGE